MHKDKVYFVYYRWKMRWSSYPIGTLIANGEVAMSLSKGKAILGRKSHLHDRIIYDIFVVEFDHCRCLIFFANTGSFLSKHPCRCHGRIECIIILTSPAKLQEKPQRLCSDLSGTIFFESAFSCFSFLESPCGESL